MPTTATTRRPAGRARASAALRWAVALALGMLVVSPASAERGLEVQVRESVEPDADVAKSVQLYRNSHALVIGIDDYTNGWPDLEMAVSDAKRVAEGLRAKGFSVTTLFNPDSGELATALKRFFARKGKDPNARLMLWYAGHGHTLDGEGFLVPTDAPDPNADAAGFKLRALPMRRFGTLVRLADSKHVLGVFDSCFSGTIFRTRSTRAPEAITDKTIKPVRQFITAGTAGQTVRDDGTFRKLFLRAIRGDARADANGDGYVTGAELGLYLNQEMAALTDSAQTPRAGKLQDVDYNQGDFVFALERGADAADDGAETGGRSPEVVFWRSIKDSNDPADFKAYLNEVERGRFDGVFASLARNRLDDLKQKTRTTSKTSGKAADAETGDDGPDFAIAERDSPHVVTTRSNVREGPGTDHDRLTTLDAGTEVTVTGKVEEKAWYRIAFGDDREGFIYAELVTARSDWEPESSPDQEQQQNRARSAGSTASDDNTRTPVSVADLDPGDTFRDCAGGRVATADDDSPDVFCGPKMVVVPPGEFRMGDLSGDGDDDERPVHRVTIDEPFAVGVHEVTFQQWDTCVARGGCDHRPDDDGWGRGRRPVIHVSWRDAQDYVDWLTEMTGAAYRLLTEAEWEYVARAGTETKFWWGDLEGFGNAVCRGCGTRWDSQSTAPVGSFRANPFGLHDVHGNADEWVQDCWHDTYQGSPRDGSAWGDEDGGDCSERVLRGGSWYVASANLRAAERYKNSMSVRNHYSGFRVARDVR